MKQYICGALALLSLACGSGLPSSPSSPTTSPVSANIAGAYNLTLTASPTCSANLPASARTLRYGATISQSGSQWQASLSGGDFSSSTFQGSVSGSTVSINLISLGDVANLFAPVLIIGTGGTGSVGSGGEIAGTFNAQFEVLGGGNCNAFNHQFRLVRR